MSSISSLVMPTRCRVETGAKTTRSWRRPSSSKVTSTTWREQIDGKYWFPTFTKADDELHFSTGDVHIREIVKYTNYKRFGSKVKITYEGQELPKTQGGQSQPQPGQPPEAQQQSPPKN